MRATRHNPGFTLIELVVVIVIIAVMAAVAVPRLFPVLAFSEHEGAARRIAALGRGVMSYATLHHEDVTVMFDLDDQVIWTEHMPEVVDEEEDEERAEMEQRFQKLMEGTDLMTLMNDPDAVSALSPEDQETLLAKSDMMDDEFDSYARQGTLRRAKKVNHERRKMKSSLFEGEGMGLSENTEELVPEELETPLIQRTRLPLGIEIDRVEVGGKSKSNGTVEVVATPVGLQDQVVVYVRNADREYFTIRWDPITGDAFFVQGEEDFSQ